MFTLIWLVQDMLGMLGPKDQRRLDYGMGFFSPEMTPHWDRLLRPWAYTWNLPKSFINVITEWNRLDAQRGWKVMFDFSLLMFVLGLLIG